MQITTGQALDALTALRSTKTDDPAKEGVPFLGLWMPASLAMKFRRIVREVGPVAEDYRAEREKLIGLYAQKDGTGPKADESGNILLADPVAFHAAHRDLLAVEHELATTVTEAEMESSGVNVTPFLLIGLGPLLVE